jgi:hypothetical protein
MKMAMINGVAITIKFLRKILPINAPFMYNAPLHAREVVPQVTIFAAGWIS